MVDAVITWVDGDDPRHRAKRERYLAVQKGNSLQKRATAPTRWRQNNELWYCVNLIRKNLPWIDHIFLVTDDQRPPWLDSQTANTMDVHLVDHTTIFRDNPQYLPTFNSISIEAELNRIPGLSNEFLYFNDDMFVVRPISQNDYFDVDVVKARGAVIWKNWAAHKLTTYLQGKATQRVGIQRYRGGKHNSFSFIRTFARAHAPYPLLKDRWELRFPPWLVSEIARYRFRDQRAIQPLDAFYNSGLLDGFVKIGPRDYACLDLRKTSNRVVLKTLYAVESDPRIKTLCVQSMDTMSEETRREILVFLDTLLQP